MKDYRNKPIGQILREKNIISEEELLHALLIQNSNQKKLGQILVNQGYITQAQLEDTLSLQKDEQLIDDLKN